MNRATATTLAIAALIVGGLGGYAATRSYNNSNYPTAPNTGGATTTDINVSTGSTGTNTTATAPRNTYNYYSTTNTYTYTIATSTRTLALRDTMRSLWEDHVRLERQFITDVAASSSPSAVENELVRNAEAIGNAIKPYYGNAAGNSLAQLLKTHISQSGDLVRAVKNSDTDKVNTLKQQWLTNSDDIARFLSGTNPDNWTYDHFDGHMHDHLNLTIQEARDQISGSYDQSISDFRQIESQIQHFADDLTSGIVAQFPSKF